MLKAADKEKLKKLGIDIDAIVIAAADAAEKDITVPEGEIFTPDQLTQRDKNTKTEGEKEGEKKALSIAVSEINKHTGLDLKADRFGDLGKQIKEKITASDDDKVKTLTTQVGDLLKDKETLTQEVATHKTQVEKTSFEYKQFQHLPENRAKNVNESEYLSLLGARNVEIKPDGIYRNGELMKDAATKGAMPHAEAYKQLFTEFKWIAEPPAGGGGGRGGGNSGFGGASGKPMKQSDAIQAWKDQNPGKNEVCPECTTFVASQAKDNPQFNWNE